jgi:hypothetical protein
MRRVWLRNARAGLLRGADETEEGEAREEVKEALVADTHVRPGIAGPHTLCPETEAGPGRRGYPQISQITQMGWIEQKSETRNQNAERPTTDGHG